MALPLGVVQTIVDVLFSIGTPCERVPRTIVTVLPLAVIVEPVKSVIAER